MYDLANTVFDDEFYDWNWMSYNAARLDKEESFGECVRRCDISYTQF
jgi:hypothetical protein